MSITKKKITNRLYVISLLLIVIIFSIVFKIIDLQFFKGDYYIDISEKREFKNIEIELLFKNDAIIKLETEIIRCKLEDQGEPWNIEKIENDKNN